MGILSKNSHPKIMPLILPKKSKNFWLKFHLLKGRKMTMINKLVILLLTILWNSIKIARRGKARRKDHLRGYKMSRTSTRRTKVPPDHNKYKNHQLDHQQPKQASRKCLTHCSRWLHNYRDYQIKTRTRWNLNNSRCQTTNRSVISGSRDGNLNLTNLAKWSELIVFKSMCLPLRLKETWWQVLSSVMIRQVTTFSGGQP